VPDLDNEQRRLLNDLAPLVVGRSDSDDPNWADSPGLVGQRMNDLCAAADGRCVADGDVIHLDGGPGDDRRSFVVGQR